MRAAARIDAEAVRYGVSLLELLPQDAKARRVGRDSYRALCSFCPASRPNMAVFLGRVGWVFYCHACHETGDAIAYVMKTQRLGFQDALRAMADGRAELTITGPSPTKPPPAYVLACDGRGCGATAKVEAADVVGLGMWTLTRWYVTESRVYCPTCVEARLRDGLGQQRRAA